MPATSVASESSFSIAGYINRKERSSLSSSQLRMTMCTKDFYKIDDIIIGTK